MLYIILSTYNGEKYLKEQLDSLYNQTYKEFKIIARDDCSEDRTLDILKSYDIEIIHASKNIGARDSFSTLLSYAIKKKDANYFMFCDQDDAWKKDKIEKTFSKMIEIEKSTDRAVLIHTDLTVVDENLEILDKSFWHYQALNPDYKRLPSLIMQNNITGCTVMINSNLAKLALPIPYESIMHDWWLGLVASKFGKIDYIDEPTMLYRQHGLNDTGAKRFDVRFLVHNLKTILKNRQQGLDKYSIQAKKFLDVYQDELDENTINMLKDFYAIKDENWCSRVMTLKRYKLYKEGFWRNIGLLFSV